jgi:hypothetical protein
MEAGHYFHDFKLDTIPAFITCFSEDGDLLSQWRAYADDGQGIAIGFRTDQLGFPVESRFIDVFMEEQRVAIAKCMYDRKAQEMQIDELIAFFDKLFNDLFSTQEPYSPYSYDLYVDTGAWCLRNMSIVSKHPGFSEECEWRAIYWPKGYGEKEGFPSALVGPRLQRIREGEDIDYHEWQLTDASGLIAEIIIGPKSMLSKEDVRNMLESQGYSDFCVKRSDIPYR